MHFRTISITVIFGVVGCVLVASDHPSVTIKNDTEKKNNDELSNGGWIKPPKKLEEDLPKYCFDIYTAKLDDDIAHLARSTLDVHAWNAIGFYVRNSHRYFIPFGRVDEYLNRCESSFGGKVMIYLQPLYKYRNDFSRPLPSTMMGARNLCEDLCVVQAAREVVLSDSFDPAKYGPIFNMTTVEILNIIEDSILTNALSKMCEKMFDAQIKCSFERKQKMLEQNEQDLVQFLLQISVDIKHHLKHRSLQERVELPDGYIENPFPNPYNQIGKTQIFPSYLYLEDLIQIYSKNNTKVEFKYI